MSNVKYYWIKFYPTAEWQIVKFWEKNNKSFLKGLDWALAHQVDKFDNKNYEIGPEIVACSSTVD